MRVSCVQMNMAPEKPDENFALAAELIKKAAQDGADTVVLPEMWNVGFFPENNLYELSDKNGERVKRELGELAGQLKINLVAGSVSNVKNGKIYNSAFVFDRSGSCIAEYDKTHLFSPMGEDRFFEKGDSNCRFTLDGISCGLAICYDVRFPELIRSMTLDGVDMFFVVSQWPDVRMHHLHTLTCARAIENQMFLACCNSCGHSGQTQYGGGSVIYDPWGSTLGEAGTTEQILSAECDFSIVDGIRKSINVFADRRAELYDKYNK